MNNKEWITEGFEAFRAGIFGNGGQNIYVSKKGILQRIHQTDVNGNGYMDLVFCNSQNHEEQVPVEVYPDPVNDPDKVVKLSIGGCNKGLVADINNNGYEDLVVCCGWDGIVKMPNSAVFWGAEEGISNKYSTLLPTMPSSAVAAGDFNSNGLKDIVFVAEGKLKVFCQSESGVFNTVPHCLELPEISDICGANFSDSHYSDLLIRKDDGSYSIIKGGPDGLQFDSSEQLLLDRDPDYVKKINGRENYTQAISEPKAMCQVINLNGLDYICAFREKATFLYPVNDYKLGEPVILTCQNALSIATGDIDDNGFVDLLITCRDKSSGTECSWLYRGGADGWNEQDRIPIECHNASDAALADFSGNGMLDIVICQSHTHDSYTNEIFIYPSEKGKKLGSTSAIRIVAHDAYRILTINNGLTRKPSLVVINRRSGRLIGDPDSRIYFGGPDGFKIENHLDLPAWGAVDMMCCDLNDNGLPDLVFVNASEMSPWLDPGSFVYYNSPAGFALKPDLKLPTTRAHGGVCGDLNHNGYLDLVFTGFDNSEIVIFYGSEQGFTSENKVSIKMQDGDKVYSEPRFLSLADLNNDGYLDLIISIINEDVSFVLWGGPDGFSFDRKQVFHVRHACNSAVADLNKNGYPDLIFGGHTPSACGPHDSFVYIYWGSAEGYREDRKTLLPAYAVNSMAIADFNNDGNLDIFVGSYEDGRLRDIDSFIYWNRGADGFDPYDCLPLRTHAVSGCIAADFNGNGHIDLAVANHKVYGDHIAYSTIWHNSQDGFDEKNTTNLPSIGIHGMGNVNPGNIMDRSPNEYYISVPYQTQAGTGVSEILWQAEIPKFSSVKAQLRFADTEAELELAPWRGSTGLGSYFKYGQKVNPQLCRGNFVQYRLVLSSYNAMNTPRISSVTVKFVKLNNQ